ncbi:permease-like cell division protein FtsX [Chitinimonas viridis]|uniref:Cell division protein FtsX n=1 Tax=Chitinimonas viridis TaxID=664880 RepID=A0ABT8B8P8_9NEIS|nr:permease-like cell division protein FtsX [Chitinimonas viridis]MDN3577859.1 permease-like cell division protein FtsX [Chitinimonas viridis]
MKHWLNLHRLALGSTLRLFATSPLASSLNLLVVGIAVALPLGLYTLIGNLSQLAGRLPTEPEASVFLQTTASQADINRIKTLLGQEPGVAEVRHISKQQALRDLEQSSGMAELLAGLGDNPLPDAFSLTLKDGNPATLEALSNRLKADPAVEHVQMDSEWARRLASFINLGREATVTIAALFGAGLLLVTANLIRMQILTRREEIEVSKLIGATDSFIRRPFLYFAALQGLLGGLVGLGLVAISLGRLATPVDQLAALYGEQFKLGLPQWHDLLMALIVVVALSLTGAIFSVRKHLRALET